MDDSERTFMDDFEELLDNLEPEAIDRAAQRSRDHGEDMQTDLRFGLQAATDEERENVEWLRMKFYESIGQMTAFVLPYDLASERHKRSVFNMCRWALQFRNSIRHARATMQGEDPPDYDPINKEKYDDWVERCLVKKSKAIH